MAGFGEFVGGDESAQPRPEAGAGHGIIAAVDEPRGDVFIFQTAPEAVAAKGEIQRAGVGEEVFVLSKHGGEIR